jgi:Arc/MetJ-type ribon-helix-helix transcriptional regulator
MKLITLYVPEEYLSMVDALVKRGLYPNRAETIRLAIRNLALHESEKDNELEKVSIETLETGVLIRESNKTFQVEICRNKDGSIWGIYPNKEINDDMIFPDATRNLLILARTGILRIEDFPRRKEKEAQP